VIEVQVVKLIHGFYLTGNYIYHNLYMYSALKLNKESGQMKKLYTLIMAMLLISASSMAQKEGLATINKSDLKAHMTFFASDEMEGRETGSHANDAAALYIKTNLMRLGLSPISETGDYFQLMPLRSNYLNPEGTHLTMHDKNGETIFSTDSIVYLMPPSSSLNATGELVFAGYGFMDTISGYNDFEEISLTDKIVLLMTGNPMLAAQNESSSMFDNATESLKFGAIFSQNPKAIFYVYNPSSKFKSAYDSGIADMISGGRPGTHQISKPDRQAFSLPFPIVFITQHTADMLLQTTGYKLEQLENQILSEGKPVSLELDSITASVCANVETKDIQSRNVIGIVEGSDPVLKDECIVYSAHFDHVGIDSKGEVFNGADDNASGSMGLLEVAEAYMNLKKKPLRTVVFAWVNAEEKGLFGSQYYTDNPIIPMENTLVNINLDMIGRSELPSDTIEFMGYELDITQAGEILVYTAHESTELTNMLNSSAKKTGLKVIDMGEEIQLGTSDHASFMAKGVPAFCFNSGTHSDLHGIGDELEKIDFDKMEKVSKMVFLLGYKVANQRERIHIDRQN